MNDAVCDVFLCHAAEDKDEIAKRLATALREHGVSVWDDEFSLKLGDSLRESIDRGLSRSRFGVVVLSPKFFANCWPREELDALATREVGGKKVILPVWQKVAFNDVREFSPALAECLAVSTGKGMKQVVESILAAMKQA